MTSNLDIIKRSMKKIHVLPAGMEPTSVQATAAMDTLSDLYVELIGMGSLGRLVDILATTNCTALPYQRVRADTGVTVSPPSSVITQNDINTYPYGWWWGFGAGLGDVIGQSGGPDYGWFYCDVFPRSPPDMCPVIVIDDAGEETSYIYVAEKGAYIEVQALGQQDDFPFADKYRNGIACILAERIIDDFAGGDVGAETKRGANACRMMLSSRFDGLQRPTAVAYF